MKNSIISKIAITVCLILVTALAIGGGTAYWAVAKLKSVADSILNVSRANLVPPPADSLTIGNLTMPTKEISGSDLAEAPRFSGSIRSNFYVSDDGNFYSVEYYAPAAASEIMDFYKKYFHDHEWIVSASDQRTATFLKEGNNLTLAIVAENKTGQILTQYSLNLTKYSQ